MIRNAFLRFLFYFTFSTVFIFPVKGSFASINNQKDTNKSLFSTAIVRVPFVLNEGQLGDEKIRFYAKTFSGAMYVTKNGELFYSLPKINGNTVKGWVIKECLKGTSTFNVMGEEKTTTKVTYITRNDPAKSKKNISTYNTISLGELYSGIEVKLRAYGSTIEKLFYIKPKANPQEIQITMAGICGLQKNSIGVLEAETKLGIVKFSKPIAYQIINGKKKHVDVSYKVSGNTYGFELGLYDTTEELVIDPLLTSTFLGGSYTDYSTCLTFDSSGNVYIAGVTESIDFPITTGVYNPTFSNGSFVAKFDSNLQNLLAATFLNENDMVHAISIDNDGNVFIAGANGAGDLRDFRYWDFGFFTGTHFNGNVSSAFVAKLDSDLKNVLASVTLQGSAKKEMATSLSLDSNGNIFVLGMTASSDFPVTNDAYNKTYSSSGWDVFISKFDNSLNNLLASTLIGGSLCSDTGCDDYPLFLSIDSSGNVYMTGSTESTDFPTTTGAYDTSHNGSRDGFISVLDNNLENLLASTFLGGSYDDYSFSLSLDSSGNVYVTGITRSTDFPTSSSAFDTSFNGNGDVFVSKLDSQLKTLIASTFIGGNGGDPGNGWFPDQGYSVYVDNSSNVYVAGCTHSVEGVSNKFPTTFNSFSPNPFNGHTNGFALKIDSNLQHILVSTFFGGDPGHDYIYAVKFDTNGSVYLTGKTGSSDFPVTSGSYDTTYNLGQEAFISKFDSNLSAGSSADLDMTGTWSYSDTNISDSCDPNPPLETSTTTVTQSGDNITIVIDGNTFTGSINNLTVNVSGSYSENGGTVTQNITVNLSSSTSGTGTSTWSWTNGNNNCNGGSDFTIEKVSISDSGGGTSGGGGGCFIATAAYGSPVQPYVKILRKFRNRFLLNNNIGKFFVNFYYKYSPPMADFIAKHANMRAIVRVSLLPVVGMSWFAMKIGPLFTMALMLFFAFGLIGLVRVRKKVNR